MTKEIKIENYTTFTVKDGKMIRCMQDGEPHIKNGSEIEFSLKNELNEITDFFQDMIGKAQSLTFSFTCYARGIE